MKVNVKIKRLSEDAVIPKYAHEWDAGVDLVAAEDVIIEPGETKIIPTGLAIALPPGYELQVRPRSGITVRTKLRVQLGTVDCTYRGDVGVIVDNAKQADGSSDVLSFASRIDGTLDMEKFCELGSYSIRKGDRIAQAVINQVEQAQFSVVEELDETERGNGGFGSSGVTS
jgi:dUTP pyrophosphatase